MIKIDGHKLSEFGLYALIDHERPILPRTNNETINIPERHGSMVMDSKLEPLPFNFPIGVGEQMSYADSIRKAEEFAMLFLDQFGKAKEVKLELDYLPGRFYKVRYSGMIPIQKLASMARFDLPLTAYDPFSYSVEFADEITWGSKTITFNNHVYTLGHRSMGSFTNIKSPTTESITVVGYAVKPIIEIEGKADNLSLNIGGQIIKLPSFNNAKWVIDCNNYTATKNGNNHYNDVRLREFWLYKGTNELKINGSNIDIDLRVKFRDKFN